jgi:tetratricopeptide (TPR) repeat protein
MRPNKKTLILILLIILGGLISYSNIFSHEFLWDDEFLIQENQFIKSWEHLPQIFSLPSGAGANRLDNFYRPLQLLLYTFIYSLVGLTPWLFLLANVLLHLGNGVLIFILIKKIFKKENLAFLTSLLWIIHPIHTEVITYMSGTADPLSVFFGLSSFCFYLNFREKKQSYFLIFSLISFILALLSKETIIILPGLFFLYEIIFSPDRKKILNYAPLIWFFIIALAYFSLRLTVLNFGHTLNLYQTTNIYTENLFIRIFTFLASLLKYYSFLFFPLNLHMERQFPVFTSFVSPLVLISFFILIILGIIVYQAKKRNKLYLVFGIPWFFIAFLPMSGIIPVNSFLLEHWLYFTSLGFFLCLAGLINDLLKKISKKFIIILIIIIPLLMGLTWKRNQAWTNAFTFYHDILQYHSGTARIHNNLGMAYVENNDLNQAEKHYLKAIELGDQYAQTHYNLARLYLKKDQTEKAINHLEKSLVLNPHFFFSYQLLADIYQNKGEIEKAQEYFKKAQEIKYY